jgi:hypothetical protein
VIETLGTGCEVPQPPNAQLAEYYAWLESDWGMKREEIRTDYAFATVADAVQNVGFFFGPEKAAWVRERGSARVPECTGVWWSNKPDTER